jgi:hypothetical protein
MKYQLVLQFPADSLSDFDELINLERALDKTLFGIAMVDGHDFGAGEFNIFILTDDPLRAFELAEPTIDAGTPLQQVKAAYRELEQEKFTILWPVGLQSFEIS